MTALEFALVLVVQAACVGGLVWFYRRREAKLITSTAITITDEVSRLGRYHNALAHEFYELKDRIERKGPGTVTPLRPKH